jgi:hypothetical protein
LPSAGTLAVPETVPSHTASWNVRSVNEPAAVTSRVYYVEFELNATPSDHVPPNGAWPVNFTLINEFLQPVPP